MKLTKTTRQSRRDREVSILLMGVACTISLIFAGLLGLLIAIPLPFMVSIHIDLCVLEAMIETDIRMMVRIGKESDLKIDWLRGLQQIEATERPFSISGSAKLKHAERMHDKHLKILNELVEDRENGINI